jgi:hypothetical protein
MIRIVVLALLPLLGFFGFDGDVTSPSPATAGGATGTLEKMIVSTGSVALDLDLSRLNGAKGRASRTTTLRFDSEKNAFFTALAFDGELRGMLPSSMAMIPQSTPSLPARLARSYKQLVLEELPWGGQYEMVIRDAKSGFVFFNIEAQAANFDADSRMLTMRDGRVLISKEFANAMGRSQDAGAIVGTLAVDAKMQTIELTQMVDGEATDDVLPPMNAPDAGTTPGPDVVVGDLSGLAQFGNAGTKVGLAVGTDSCNFGTQNLHWFASPDNDHPVIPQNLYRMSGGANGTDRFEQIGQSNVKHAFTALANNICNLGCNGTSGTNLGSGCSDPYSASLNSGPNLGSRAWINPFTGAYPRGDSATPPNNHTGHTHDGISHRILVEVADLNTTLNPGATYWAESQYVTPHEYQWCQSNPGQCNMYNNVSHRKYTVTGTASPFSFSAAAVTVREKPALSEWTGSTSVQIQPDPGNDGIGVVAWKVTNPSPGVWHYEYAVYNQNIDRGIQSFSVPVGPGVVVSNIGFHMPPQQPGWANDGTLNNTGYSSAPWTSTQSGGYLTWASETQQINPNANAIRWGTLYNFRFDANQPPVTNGTSTARVGYFKTGVTVNLPASIQTPNAPTAAGVSISGRVTNSAGYGLRNARLTVTLPDGGTRSVVTNGFGFYQFTDISLGAITIAASAKGYSFSPQAVSLTDTLTGIDFTPIQ